MLLSLLSSNGCEILENSSLELRSQILANEIIYIGSDVPWEQSFYHFKSTIHRTIDNCQFKSCYFLVVVMMEWEKIDRCFVKEISKEVLEVNWFNLNALQRLPVWSCY